ncbi:PREDICTED: protein strawberry notch homolog 1-like isoform X1 [Acropora digitifera]|uniref:protein strawberry notch homolog 1-like isoform X1 n=1 Tax=Acropora digitifera TaxID=70779 RepID=UPI00077A8B66|nr:PREDICTED: protein strawberry notch homolog 1-like isoform X1 [Acropora digitifera]
MSTGRSHRSNQVSAPEYLFLISELAGERRFASIVAKRLESLGALTHGDRRATESQDLSRYNFDNKHSKTALEAVLKAVTDQETPVVPPPKDYGGNFLQDLSAHGEAVNNVSIQAFPGNSVSGTATNELHTCSAWYVLKRIT